MNIFGITYYLLERVLALTLKVLYLMNLAIIIAITNTSGEA